MEHRCRPGKVPKQGGFAVWRALRMWFDTVRQAMPSASGGDFHDREDFGPVFWGKTLRDHGNGAPGARLAAA
jgi:hypothetical protein